MRYLFLMLLLSFGIQAQAGSSVDINQFTETATLPAVYKVPAYPALETLKQNYRPELLSSKEAVVRAGAVDIVAFDEAEKLYVIYNSKTVYVKRPLAQVVKAFHPFSASPYPYPMIEASTPTEKVVSPTHLIQYYQFTTSHSQAGFSVKAKCLGGATHFLNLSANHSVQQTVYKDCVDTKDETKLWYREGWQTDDMVAISPEVTGVLMRDLVVIKRNKIGILNPPLSEMKAGAIKVSEKGLTDVLARLNITPENSDRDDLFLLTVTK